MMQILKSKTEFLAFVQQPLALVTFCTPRCGPCELFSRQVDAHAGDLRHAFPTLRWAKIDCGVIPSLTSDVKFVPTIALYRAGRRHDLATGFLNHAALVAAIREKVAKPPSADPASSVTPGASDDGVADSDPGTGTMLCPKCEIREIDPEDESTYKLSREDGTTKICERCYNEQRFYEEFEAYGGVIPK